MKVVNHWGSLCSATPLVEVERKPFDPKYPIRIDARFLSFNRRLLAMLSPQEARQLAQELQEAAQEAEEAVKDPAAPEEKEQR
jgi:hypothetical protein